MGYERHDMGWGKMLRLYGEVGVMLHFFRQIQIARMGNAYVVLRMLDAEGHVTQTIKDTMNGWRNTWLVGVHHYEMHRMLPELDRMVVGSPSIIAIESLEDAMNTFSEGAVIINDKMAKTLKVNLAFFKKEE